MFHSWLRRALKRPPQTIRRDRSRRAARIHLEALEDRCVPAGTVTIGSLTLAAAVEGLVANPSLSATFTDTAGPAAASLTATVDYGDGTALSSAGITRVGATTSYTVTDTHTYPEESGGFGFNATLHVFENANPSTNTDTLSQRVVVADAALAAGALAAGVTHQEFSGVGGTNAAGGAFTALTAFEAAIGGVRNSAAAPQNGGFRTITWDGVAVDGTDFGGNTTVIVPNKVVGIPINRFQTQGSLFETIYAVSGDGFKSVNPNVNAHNPALFPSFSPTKTFAMFNDNGIDFRFVLPSGANTAPADAASRGFGAIFLNVQLPNTTSIEYFDGNNSLGKFFVPVGTQGVAEFLGELFSSPVVTRVSIVLGTDVLFSFNGTTFSGGGADNPGAGHNLVATDDFVYAEPVAAPALQAPVNAVVGTFFNGPVATFTDANAGASFHDFTGSINWGDGFTSPATFTALGGGKFAVNGSHTYVSAGAFAVNVLVQDFGGNTLTTSNTATVSGDAVVNGTAGNDTFTLSRTSGGALGSITFVLNGNATSLQGLTSLTFNGLGGNDTMTVSLANGNPVLSGNVVFDGGNNSDTLIVDASQLPVRTVLRGITAGSQALLYPNVETINLNNAGAVNSIYGPNTVNRATALAGLDAQHRFVQVMYLNALGRAGSGGELDFWVKQLNSPGVTQGQVAAMLEQSLEARTRLVRTWYLTYLGRAAVNNEEQPWVNLLLQGQTEETALAGILGVAAGGEFFARAQFLAAGATPNERYIQALYQVLLNRTAADAEVQFWLGVLGQSGAKAVVQMMLGSTEYRNDLVEGYYDALLHRPSDAGLASWVSSGLDAKSIRVGFEGTGEFFSAG